jgi:hypothetical protein
VQFSVQAFHSSDTISQNYYEGFVKYGLISPSRPSLTFETPSSPSVSDCPRCPFCACLLITCLRCSNITCENFGCKGANLVASCQPCFSTLALSKKCSEDNCFTQRCSEIDCSARAHFIDGTICPDCVKPTDGHILCACGDTWVCGPCATQNILNLCGHCPRCQNCFCVFWCEYINVCVDCHKMTFCNDCMEEALQSTT